MNLIKSFLVVIMGVVLMAQSMSRVIILANFEINRNFIASNLCVQKEEPDNCCQGSCQLKKQVDEDSKKNDEAGIVGSREIFIHFLSAQDHYSFNNTESMSYAYASYHTPQLADASFSIFHPPKGDC